MDEQKKYIDAEETISEIKQWYWSANIQSIKDDPCVVDAMIDMFIRTIREQKAADVQPVKRGRWIESNPQNSDKCRLIECDQCGNSYIVGFNVSYEDWTQSDNKNYCGRCGAYMR